MINKNLNSFRAQININIEAIYLVSAVDEVRACRLRRVWQLHRTSRQEGRFGPDWRSFISNCIIQAVSSVPTTSVCIPGQSLNGDSCDMVDTRDLLFAPLTQRILLHRLLSTHISTGQVHCWRRITVWVDCCIVDALESRSANELPRPTD